MRRILRKLILLCLILMSLAACGKEKTKISISDADEMNIFYGVSSYAQFNPSKDAIEKIANNINSLTFERTDKELNFSTAYRITFLKETKPLQTITVDANGIIWLNGETVCYKISGGKLDYNYIKKVYEVNYPKLDAADEKPFEFKFKTE